MRAGIDAEFDQARAILQPDRCQACREFITSTSEPTPDDRFALARAVVAQVLVLRPGHDPDLPIDRDALNAAAALIEGLLGEPDRSSEGRGIAIGQHVKAVASAIVRSIGTFGTMRYRGRLTEASALIIGDILLYQSRGKTIQDAIAKEVHAHGPGVILLAHSLGGIAAVDLLVNQPSLYTLVNLLVTVGSQSPFLYEIGALSSRKFGEPLPPDFPDWLNFYDLADFLSYVGSHPRLFWKKIKDIPVYSRQSFPDSHGAYFECQDVWDAIVDHLTAREKEMEKVKKG